MKAKIAKKAIFPVLGAILDKTRAEQICLHADCGPSESCLGSHVSPASEMRALGGGLGAISSVEDRFCLLGTQPTKNCFSRNSAPPGSFREFFSLS